MHLAQIARRLAQLALLVCLMGSPSFGGVGAPDRGPRLTSGLGGTGSSSYIPVVVLRDRDASSASTSAPDAVREAGLYSRKSWRADVSLATSFGADSGCEVSTSSIDSGTGRRDVFPSSMRANRIGYGGYRHAPEAVETEWHVRHRVLDSELGRWTRRDPANQFDPNLFAYSAGAPHNRVDPLGLLSVLHFASGAPDPYSCPPGWVWNLYANACVPNSWPTTYPPLPGVPTVPTPDEFFCDQECRTGFGYGLVSCNNGRPVVCNCVYLVVKPPMWGTSMAAKMDECTNRCEYLHLARIRCSGPNPGFPTERAHQCSECAVNTCLSDCFQEFDCSTVPANMRPLCDKWRTSQIPVAKGFCDACDRLGGL